MTEIGEILNDDLVELLEKLGLASMEKIAGCSDEELLAIPGVGPATLKKLRTWKPESKVMEKKDARECVSMRFLAFGDLNVAPGDIIPPEYADEQVAKGKARWR